MVRNSGAIVLILSVLAVVGTGPQSARATTLTGKVNADNAFWAYLSTNDSIEGVLIGSGDSWPTTYTFSRDLTPGKINYLHVKVLDGSPPAAFLGEFHLSDAQFHFVNQTGHLLTNTADWNVSVAGFGVNYSTPGFQGLNGVAPWYTRADVSASAAWLWNNQGGNPSYFSTPIIPVPEPAGLTMLALGSLGLLYRRR